jgi:branched-chain amino acid transport system ATP-binding protein
VLLRAEDISMEFDGFRAVAGASLEVAQGEIVGVIGPNGAGKSTLFNCLVGDLKPSAGRVFFDDHDVTRAPAEAHARLGIGRTFQLPATFEELTILENVMVGAFLRHRGAREARAAAERVLALTGLDEIAHHKARSLGTPGRKRLEIARVLATEPKLMLLDEALAGLTPVEVQKAIELVRSIHRSGITLVIVEHIMEVIIALAERVLVLNQGRVIASGTPTEVVNDEEVINAYLGHSHSRRHGAQA